MMKHALSIHVLLLLLIVWPRATSASMLWPIKQASTKQISSDVFSCTSSDPTIRAICHVLLDKVNNELASSNIQINSGGVLFSFDDPTDKKISTGRSCTLTAKYTHVTTSALFSRGASLNLTATSLTEPFMLRLQLPVSVSGRISVKQSMGVRAFGCRVYATDRYTLNGRMSTTADIGVGIYVNTSIGVLSNGDYSVRLAPSSRVALKLQDTDIRFHASGVSPLTSIWTSIVAHSTAIFSAVDALFDGKSVIDDLLNSAGLAYAVPIALGYGALPRRLESALWDLLFRHHAQHKVEKKAAHFGRDLEDDLDADLRRALGTNSAGYREYIVKKEIVELLRLGHATTEIVQDLPVDEAVACFTAYGRTCSRFGCNGDIRPCEELRRQFLDTYKADRYIPALPQVAVPLPSPTPSAQARCREGLNDLCNSCRGCQTCIDRWRACNAL